jgi:hypothetical protein
VRRKRIFIVLTVCVLVGIGVLAFWPGEKEPEYNGKKLSEWLSEGPISGDGPRSAAEKEAMDAVRHMGTNALPYLIRWMRYERRPWRNRLYALLEKFPNKGPLRVAGRPDVLATCAPYGFKSLVAAAAPAVPDLVRLMNDREAPPVAQANAAWVLANLGSNGLPALLAVITNQASTKRAQTISLICGTPERRLEQGPAVPVLIDCLNDKDLYVAQQAARALGQMGMEPDVVVPALANCLKDPRAEVRDWAVAALARYQERARSAVPALLEAQAGASNEFRKLIADALGYIAPEVLTNGVKDF